MTYIGAQRLNPRREATDIGFTLNSFPFNRRGGFTMTDPTLPLTGNQASGFPLVTMENSGSGCGIYGSSVSASGVFGFSSSTSPTAGGVHGYSTTGPGIFGQGSPAGFFQGDVTVTGNLTINGSNILQLLNQLESAVASLQGDVSSLQGQIAGLQAQSGPPGPPGPPGSPGSPGL
jgi:hypothetical protein